MYNGSDLSWVRDIECDSNILAIEYCVDKNMIAVSLANRTIVFFEGNSFSQADGGKKNTKPTKYYSKLCVPSTQKCLRYVKRKQG